ncbi:MAG: hypothetical protein ACK5PF_05295, partial [bacterium]
LSVHAGGGVFPGDPGAAAAAALRAGALPAPAPAPAGASGRGWLRVKRRQEQTQSDSRAELLNSVRTSGTLRALNPERSRWECGRTRVRGRVRA